MRTRSVAAACWTTVVGTSLAALISTAMGQTAATSAPAKSPTASAPATQPDSEIILFRVGNKAVVTQKDFAAAAQMLRPDEYERHAMSIIRRLMELRLFELYLADHPDLVPPAKLNANLEKKMKNSKMASLDEVKKRFAEEGVSFEAYCDDLRLKLAKAELIRQGTDLGNDTAALKKLYDDHPSEHDGTSVEARQIMLLVAPTDTPAEREAKRSRIAKMREDILAGKRTWDQCVSESDFRNPNGNMGSFTRHGGMTHELIAKTAFALEVGQFSDILCTPLGYHLIHVVARKPGNRPFSESKIQRNMRLYLSNARYQEAIEESFLKHPVVGVQLPRKPAKLGTAIKQSVPSFADLERMLSTRPAASQPAGTRPAGSTTKGATTRPARPTIAPRPPARPATKPAVPAVPPKPAAK